MLDNNIHVDGWTEIFENLKFNVIPLNYIQTIRIIFKNKKIWKIRLTKNIDFDNQLYQILNEYKLSIKNVEFDLNKQKIKKEALIFNKKFLNTLNLK